MKRALSYPAGFFMKTKKTTFICEIIKIIIDLKYSRKIDGPTPVRDSNDHFGWLGKSGRVFYLDSPEKNRTVITAKVDDWG